MLFVEGNGSRTELGRVAIWSGAIPNCVHQNHIIKARLDLCVVLPEYAMIWFNTEAGRDHFFRAGKTTSGLGTINSNVIRAAPIPLPPLTQQMKLVADIAGSQRIAARQQDRGVAAQFRPRRL